MSNATLKLTDCPEGLNMEVFYEGGFNPLSPAHIHVEALIAKMAELAEPIGEAVHLSADEVAAMQANALLTSKGAQELPALSTKDENAAGFAKLREAAEAQG